MVVSTQPDLSPFSHVLQGSDSKCGPRTAASIHREPVGKAHPWPRPPQTCSTRNLGAGLAICASSTPRRCCHDSGLRTKLSPRSLCLRGEGRSSHLHLHKQLGENSLPCVPAMIQTRDTHTHTTNTQTKCKNYPAPPPPLAHPE